MKPYPYIILSIIGAFLWLGLPAQIELTAEDIIRQADEKTRGQSSVGALTMRIIRPKWEREVGIKTWTKGDDYSLILITSPVREKGTAFLKREKELWNWQPTIDRVIKLPPSMMMQSWMGSDFTNDDLVKESSILEDYTHEILGKDMIEEYECYQLQLTPKEDAPVVWGKILLWIDVQEFMQLKTEFYDEDDYLVNTMLGQEIKMMDDRLLPSQLVVIPADEPENRTVVIYDSLKFNQSIKESIFSVQQMKRIR